MNTRNSSSTNTVPTFVSSSGWLVVGVVILIFFFFCCFKMFENLDVHRIMCVQSPVKGELTWYTTAGLKWQGFGKITKYDKRSMYKFDIPVRFNDGGHATMRGSVQFEMPADKTHLSDIQSKFGNDDNVRASLIQTVVNKCIYMTGPMMSSKESYAEKRNYLINYVEDQIQNGIFKTVSRDTVVKDNFSGSEKTITLVEVLHDKNGTPLRQEESALSRFGIKAFNFAIENMPYDATVEAQIKQQQSITMDIQTSIADAKKAEQNVITVEANGKASAATAKWQQEVIKAKAVTEAQQQLEVATLRAKAAEQTKREQILLGEGEGARKRLVMQANGALEQKLEAYVKVQGVWADAFAKFGGSIVPQFQMAGSSGTTANGATNFMELMSAYAAKNLALDMSVPKK